jgi:hypothetical protein
VLKLPQAVITLHLADIQYTDLQVMEHLQLMDQHMLSTKETKCQ